MSQLTFLSEEPPAKASASLGLEKDLAIRVATSPLPILLLLKDISPVGSFGKMSPVSCLQTKDGILVPSSEGWQNSGMGGPTECWTLNIVEWMDSPELSLNGEGVSLLSDILEIGGVPQRYYLTPKACAGILRRAERRGKSLPPALEKALKAGAIGTG